jgi:hypothetical protein
VSFLEFFPLGFISFRYLARAGFAELPWRPENSTTMILFALLKVQCIALLAFLFGEERLL